MKIIFQIINRSVYIVILSDYTEILKIARSWDHKRSIVCYDLCLVWSRSSVFSRLLACGISRASIQGPR